MMPNLHAPSARYYLWRHRLKRDGLTIPKAIKRRVSEWFCGDRLPPLSAICLITAVSFTCWLFLMDGLNWAVAL